MTILTSQELLQQQLSAPKRRKPKGVKPSAKVQREYNAALRQLVIEVSKDINTHIMPVVRSMVPDYVGDSVPTADSWVDVLVATIRNVTARWSSPAFQAVARRIAERFVTESATINSTRNRADLGIDVFVDNQELLDYVSASIYDNTRLITSIPEQYLTNVESIIMTNVRAGMRPSAMEKLLVDQFGVTERRAKMIARDQTAKLNGDLNRIRQQSAGFPYFEWDDSDDERVRKRHDEIARKVTAYGPGIYRWDNPPLSDRGTPIIPGSDFSCRCIARGVTQAEVDRNVAQGRTRPGVLR